MDAKEIRSRSAAHEFLAHAIHHILRSSLPEAYCAKYMGAESEDAYFILRHAQNLISGKK
jgi:hypothetical protein